MTSPVRVDESSTDETAAGASGARPCATLLYPCIRDRIARLREALRSPRLSPATRERREARLAVLEAELAEAPAELGDHAPALERWRREVIALGPRARPLELAAAYEVTALEFDRVQDEWGARRSRQLAADALRRL